MPQNKETHRLDPLLSILAGVIVATTPLYLVRFSIAHIPTTVLELLIYVFFAAVAIAKWRQWRSPGPSIRWATLLFLIAALLGTVISPDKRVAFGILKAWFVDPILFAWVVYQLGRRERILGNLTTGLFAGGLFISVVAIVQRILGQLTADGRVLGPYGWSAAENASPNYLALFLAPIVVLAGGFVAAQVFSRGRTMLQDVKDKGTLVVAGTTFLSCMLALIFSLSRGGLGALVVGLAAIPIVRYWQTIWPRTSYRLALLAFLIVVILGGWVAVRPNPNLSPAEGGRITASNNVRWEIWKTTVKEIIPVHPLFGIGLGNFQPYFTTLTAGRVNYDRIAPLALTPHDLFLALWVNLGLLGLVAFLWLMIAGLRAALTALWQERRGTNAWVGASLIGSLIALVTHGLLDTPYFKNDLSLLFWTLLVLLLVWTEGERKGKEEQT